MNKAKGHDERVKKLVLAIGKASYPRCQLVADMGLKQGSRYIFRHNYLNPAYEKGLVEMVYSNVPTKPEQVYRLTPEGLALWSELTTPPAAKIEKRNACPHNSIEATYSSPLGRIILESDGEVLTGLRFVETVEAPQQAIETIPADTTDTLPIFAEVRQWLDDYFVGKRPCNVPRLNPPG